MPANESVPSDSGRWNKKIEWEVEIVCAYRFCTPNKWGYWALLSGHPAGCKPQVFTMNSCGLLGYGLFLLHSRALISLSKEFLSVQAKWVSQSERNSGKLIGILHSPFLKIRSLLCRQKWVEQASPPLQSERKTVMCGNTCNLLQHAMGMILNKWRWNLLCSDIQLSEERDPLSSFFTEQNMLFCLSWNGYGTSNKTESLPKQFWVREMSLNETVGCTEIIFSSSY